MIRALQALHGFLGSGRDWSELLSRYGIIDVTAPDLFAKPLEARSIAQWARAFIRTIPDRESVLIGYSLGGRLALQALLAAPSLFRKAVIVSAGLGIESESERSQRLESDESWARRFESEPWEPLVDAWNRQPLFASSRPVAIREESHFSRPALAAALRHFSPAVQEPVFPRLSEITIPILWVAGQRDERYAAEAERAVGELARGELLLVPEAGHRAPWDQPEHFMGRLREFLRD